MKVTNNNSKGKDNLKVNTLIPITLDEMTQITGGTPVVPDIIIRAKKTAPPST